DGSRAQCSRQPRTERSRHRPLRHSAHCPRPCQRTLITVAAAQNLFEGHPITGGPFHVPQRNAPPLASFPLSPPKERKGNVMQNLQGKSIAILATTGFEQSDLEVPRNKLREAGAEVHVISLEPGHITGWDKDDWGGPVPVDKTLDSVTADDYDAIVLPGGQINPDLLRIEPQAIDFVKRFWTDKKVVAAICHAPWLLIEAGIANGRK